MNIHKINKILQVLSNDEVKRFGRTLKNKNVLKRLFTYLNDSKKDLDDIDKMVKYVFGNQVHANPQKYLRTKSSDLYKLLKNWLIAKELETDELTQNKLLANTFKRRQLYALHLEYLQESSKAVAAQQYQDIWYHSEQLQLAHQLYFRSNNNFRSTEAAENFAKIKHHFDEFCALAQSMYLIEQHGRYIMLKSPKIWDESKIYIGNSPENPLTVLYKLLLKINQNPDNKIYKHILLPLFKEHINALHPEDRSTLITLQLNYVISRIRAGEMNFVEECYKAYRTAIDKKYLECKNPLNTGHFLNAVVIAAGTEELEWCEQLIRNAPARLEGEVENIVRLAEAFLHFYKKDMEKTRQLLNEITFKSLIDRLRLRSLKAQFYYELFRTGKEKDSELLMDYLNAYEKFIRRKKRRIGNDLRDSNINLINLLKKLVNHPYDARKILTDTLRNTEKQVIVKIWLWTLIKNI